MVVVSCGSNRYHANLHPAHPQAMAAIKFSVRFAFSGVPAYGVFYGFFFLHALSYQIAIAPCIDA
jgi:hypothetical protein